MEEMEKKRGRLFVEDGPVVMARPVSRVLEAAKKLSQVDREERMKEEDAVVEAGRQVSDSAGAKTRPAKLEATKPNFEERLAAEMGVMGPEQLRQQAEKQDLLASGHLPPSLGMQMIAIRDIRESPTNPRKRKGNIDELIASIAKMGVLQPPLVRLFGTTGTAFETVFGHQRLRAAKEAGLDEVLCDVRDLTDNDVLEAQAVENIQRSDLHELEEAEHYGLMRQAGYSSETIAEKIGMSKGHVVGRIKLLDLCPEGRSAFYDGTLPSSVATPLARIYPSDVQAKALSSMLKDKMSARQMIEYLQREFSQTLKGAPFNPKDETLVEAAGACTVCPHNANNMAPTLFGDFEGGLERQGLCLHTVCYGVKCRAQYARNAAKAKDAGAEVLSASEARQVLNANGSIAYQAPFVKADDIIQTDSKKRTWEQIFEKLEPEARPALTVAPDAANPGKMVRLFDRKAAMKAAKELGLKWALAASPSKTPEEKADLKAIREKERAASAKQEAVLKVTKLTVSRLAERWSTKAGLPQLRALASELFAKRKMFEEEDQEFIFGGFDISGSSRSKKVPSDRAVENWIEKEASKEELIGLSLVLVCWDRWTDTGDDFEPQFADLAAEAGANLKEGLRAEQMTVALEAEKNGAKK